MDATDDRYARRIEGRVRRFIGEQGLFASGERILLAVSGGPDSLALLLSLSRLSPRLGATLAVAYVDHGVRPPAETAADRELVAAVAGDLDVPFVAGSIDRDERESGRSPEDILRRGRYRALARLAAEADANVVATGHTRTDQAETVLLRIVRGTGLHGLGAMAASAAWPVPLAEDVPRPRLIRPLLSLGRDETAAYCAGRGVVPRADPENENPRYGRTRIRRDVLPLLRALNPRVEMALARLAGEAAAWRAMPMSGGHAVSLEERADGIALDRRVLRGLPERERMAALRDALMQFGDERSAPAGAHLRALARLIAIDRAGAAHLPGGLRAWTDGGWLRLGRERPGVEPLPTLPVPVPGEVALPGWRVSAAFVEAARPPAGDDPWAVTLDGRVAGGLEVGPRRPGDRIDIGVGHSRVQDLLIDRKVPRAARERLPVFRTGRGVAWVAGLRVAEWAKPSSGPPFLALRVQAIEDGHGRTPQSA